MGKSPIPRQGAKIGVSISRANLAYRPLAWWIFETLVLEYFTEVL